MSIRPGRTAGGKLRCEKCTRPARFVQITGSRGWGDPTGRTSRARLVCRDHGFRGYEIPVRELSGDGMADWMRHLSEKVWRGDLALRELLGGELVDP